ncbi:MAG: TRAP transporter permease [Salinarimonas sp.]|nr:TRAP transporter permease [Salinarimonas sp.]
MNDTKRPEVTNPLNEAPVVPLTSTGAKPAIEEEARFREVTGWVKGVFVALTLTAIFLAVNQLFNLRLFVGVVIIENRYLYLLAGIFLALAYAAFPISQRARGGTTPWYDLILAALSLGACGYFTFTAHRSLMEGWEYSAPPMAMAMSFLLWLLIIEATRRTGGLVIAVIVFFFSLYPVFADVVPGPISGFAQPFDDTIAYHLISNESSFGIPMKAFGQLVIGFILFGATLQFTGGGRFFNNLALALVGGFRGGAAKVAIFASGFMGSMSGSVVSNVLTTGVVSIPAMKRAGFSSRYAAGTEACASTGGVLMPPVMGTTAFVMASFLGMPYSQIIIAAAIPSILYYLGLFVQIDAYAARNGLKGMPRSELPSLKETFREGWHYIFVFAILIVMMIVFRQETLAPFYATAALIVINQIHKSTRLNVNGFINLLTGVGRSLAELVAILLGVGLIIGAFSATGLAGTLANDLVFLAGNNVFVLLIMGALTAFIFGMGMTVTACYIFLAVVLAPALMRAGLDPLAVHLFIMYWGMVSFITPPVALGAFAAATIARTSPIMAGLQAMRLGSIIYVVPFFFVLNPALIGRGSTYEVVTVLITALIGVWFIGSSLQGYLAGVGDIGRGALAMLRRLMLAIGGLFLAAPGHIGLGLDHMQMTLIGLAFAVPVILLRVMRKADAPARS